MLFINVLGHNDIKEVLINEVSNGRSAHAQLFNEIDGVSALPMALAFSMYLFCNNKSMSDSCGTCASCKKMLKLVHPDVHFFFPSKSAGTIKSGSKESFPAFQKMLLNNPYFDESDWYASNNMKAPGEIRVSDARVINKIANLKSYEGGFKVFIIWHAEKMNPEASNKLLKNIEEPNEKTVFIVITKSSNLLLPTIKSRLQSKVFKALNVDILKYQIQQLYPDLNEDYINNEIHALDCNYNNIVKHLSGKLEKDNNYNMFIDWVRLCFLSTKKKQLADLIEWCNSTASLERSKQLNFIKAALDLFRFGYLIKYNPSIEVPKINRDNFNFDKFADRIKSNNIIELVKLLNNAFYALERYANAKILFVDLSFSIGKLLHK